MSSERLLPEGLVRLANALRDVLADLYVQIPEEGRHHIHSLTRAIATLTDAEYGQKDNRSLCIVLGALTTHCLSAVLAIVYTIQHGITEPDELIEFLSRQMTSRFLQTGDLTPPR